MQPPRQSLFTSVPAFVAELSRLHLLEASQLEQVIPAADSPEQLAGALIQRGWLTPYQADSLFEGKGDELLLGDFVLLERLGQGGMGTIYKARHPDGHFVAIKILRPERMNSVEAVRRFYREVRIASKLSHPNVMPALAADQVGDRHFFIMDYLEGIDLDRLVRERGPLPVGRACLYLKQAALGLQHAHEHGLVHRDIKPSNLFVTASRDPAPGGTRRHDPPGAATPPRESSTGVRRGGQIKVLDLGLARVQTGDVSTQVLTKQGLVMGSLDFIAPEQTLDSHHVDIRADLYSLGCTFYFALTGQVPFPGGTASAKLVQHQKDTPAPIEEARPEVPPDVAAIIVRLMAKQPAQRFQTPAALAVELDTILKQIPLEEEEDETPSSSDEAWDNSPTVWYHKTPTMRASQLVEAVAEAAGGEKEKVSEAAPSTPPEKAREELPAPRRPSSRLPGLILLAFIIALTIYLILTFLYMEWPIRST
ncbi:MAG: protein kinase [Gemmataceae bacterium]